MGELRPLSALFEKKDDILRVLSKAVEQSASTVVITNLQGTILYVNSRFTELTGYTRSEAIGNNPRILKSGKTSPEVYRDMWQTISVGEEWRGELLNKKKNGEFYWESLTISPIYNDQNVLTHYLAIEEEITKRKILELELERSVSELKRSNAELGGFTSVIAHDLSGPLANIITAIDIMLEENEEAVSADNHQLLSIARNSAKKAVELVRDLLQYARVDGHREIFKDVDIKEVLASVMESLSFELKEVHAEINIDEMPVVKGDKLLISQVFQNLITNAIKYRNDSPPILHITAQKNDDNWLFSIIDNGIGMDSEEVAKIFEPFYRIASSSNRPGSGIGLATCYKVVKLHGGKIWAESEIGKGSKFFFTLPH